MCAEQIGNVRYNSMGEVLFRRVDSPLGMITLAGDGEALTGL